MTYERSVWIAANGLVLLIPLLAAALLAFDPDLYYRSVQEDEVLEWESFWAFALAAAAHLASGLRERRARGNAVCWPLSLGGALDPGKVKGSPAWVPPVLMNVV